MVRKSTSVLACLLPVRFGFGSVHKPDVAEKLADAEDDPFKADLMDVPAPSFTPNGDIGESPNPASPPRQKRSSFTSFFAFSSKKKPVHLQRDLLSPQSVPGRWLSGTAQTQVHLMDHSAIPSPLRADEEEYYYSYYTSVTPTSPHPNALNISQFKRPSLQQRDLFGNPDLDSHPSSDTHQAQHPCARPTPLCSRPHSKTMDASPSLRHTTSQTFHFLPSDLSPTLVHSRAASSRVCHQASQSHPSHPKLKTSISTPNLAERAAPVRARSLTKKRPSTRPKAQERVLSAETWWDALLSPSPRFKVRQTARPHTATGSRIHHPASKPVEGEPDRSLGVTFPSILAARPRAVSATSNVRPAFPTIVRSRSATDLSQSYARTGFEPALETLVDEPTLAQDHAACRDTEISSLEPPLSLAEVIDEGQAFEEQRARWKRQATQSIGNKRTRSFSRTRSKSLSEKHVRAHGTSESNKVHFDLEFLAARSLLGSQSTMPTVHVIRPSNSSTHSKVYSHSHSATHASHSRTYSHSHSHSLTTSNSSKSSRNPRGHSRNGSWSRTALLKAGALCGFTQDDSCGAADEKALPPSSRVDLQDVIHIGAPTDVLRAPDTAQVSPSPDVPTDEVGIAISSSPPLEGPSGPPVAGHSHLSGRQHKQGDRETRSPKPSHKSSDYAGPHPSEIDSNLPQLSGANPVSARHRLPPRATIYPPINPITHPYGTMSSQPCNRAGKGATPIVIDSHLSTESCAGRSPYPHISLSHADFEQYSVGEALVYASFPKPCGVSETKRSDVESDPFKLSPPGVQSCPFETVVSQREGSDSASMAVNNPPSLTNSTIQMVMSAFNNPDDLDEFQDLFYKPHAISGDQQEASTMTMNQLPIDVRSSASSSPLTHLVRKLSEEVHGRQDHPRAPSDVIYLQRSEPQVCPSSENVTKIVFLGLPRTYSPPPMDSSLQLQAGEESTTRPVVVVPQDVDSSYTASVLESLPAEENDTFGRPIKHGQLDAVTAPSPTQSSVRVSTHLSIQESETGVDESAFLNPTTNRRGLPTVDAVRSSAVTTSDLSQMSGIFDFPLPPSTQPGEDPAHASLLHSYFDATPSLSESQSDSLRVDETEMEQEDRYSDSEEDGEPSGDVGKTLHARRASRVASRRTFGENDMRVMTRLHQAHHDRDVSL